MKRTELSSCANSMNFRDLIWQYPGDTVWQKEGTLTAVLISYGETSKIPKSDQIQIDVLVFSEWQ
jgi:hypothetical protein